MAHLHHHHGGDHDDPPLTTARAQRLLFAAGLAFALAAIVCLVLLWPDCNRPVLAEELGMGAELVDATVTHVEEVACANTDEEMGIRCNETTFDVTSGTHDGESATFAVPVTEASVQLEAGDKVVLCHPATNDHGFKYSLKARTIVV